MFSLSLNLLIRKTGTILPMELQRVNLNTMAGTYATLRNGGWCHFLLSQQAFPALLISQQTSSVGPDLNPCAETRMGMIQTLP